RPFHTDGAATANIEPHHLKKHRAGALYAVRDNDDRDAANLQRRATAKLEREPGIDSAPPDTEAVGQSHYRGRRGIGFGEVGALQAVEPRLEMHPNTLPMRLGSKVRIVKDAEQRVLDLGLVKRAQQKDRVAAPAATRVVGDI